MFAGKKNLRLLLTGELPDPARAGLIVEVDRRRLARPVARQWRARRRLLKVVTKRAPTEQELADCLFAWTVAKHVKSNAIVYAKDGATAGIGAGQMNRLEFGADRRLEGEGRGREGGLGRSRARSARRSRPTPSSPSPTACSRRSRRARRR